MLLQISHSYKFIASLTIAAITLASCSTEIDTEEKAGFSPQDISLESYQTRPIEDDLIYFLLPDRFENGDPSNDTGQIPGNIADHGFDPTHKGFFHGGDLQGVTKKLDYIQSLGATAIWITPIYKNKAVQGEGDAMSSGYHGYWITDFMAVDEHLGGNEALKELVDEAHARNMKVILDIVTNHTADVIKYLECHDPAYQGPDKPTPDCPYRNKAEYPYTLYKGDQNQPINDGFLGDGPEHQTLENFAKLTRPDYAYTPYIPEGEEDAKNPAWLNDVSLYHNRGETTFEGENSLYGDFHGLDDVFTEHPRVVEGFIDIFKTWISTYKIDGFRVDTTRHVNDSFWQKMVPPLLEHAKAEGIPNFYIFGEVYDFDPKSLSRFTREVGLPAVLDFGFAGKVWDVIGKGEATDKLEELFAHDDLYGNNGKIAYQLPTFISNHDMGRLAYTLKETFPDISDEDAFKNIRLAHALMIFSRGVPVFYYGDEQGFVGDGGDQAAREDMFPSRVDSYNDNDLIATDKTTADDNFDQSHPLFSSIQEMSALYLQTPALRHGKQTVLKSENGPGIFVFERATSDQKIVALFNTHKDKSKTFSSNEKLETLYGDCAGEITVAPLDFKLCKVLR